MSVQFNPEVVLNEEINKSMSKVVSEYAIRVVIKCAKRYNFDADEAIAYLNLRETTTIIQPDKKVELKKSTTTTDEVVGKPTILFPYSYESKPHCCSGLNLNSGLFTQCELPPKFDGFCGRCNMQMGKNSHGKPSYGTIQDRNSVDLLSYVDPSGRKVNPYVKYMLSKKLSKEDVLLEAGKFNVVINDIHFEISQDAEDTKKKAGGRPPVKKSVIQSNDDEDIIDLFEVMEAKARQAQQPSVEIEIDNDFKETEIIRTLLLEEIKPVEIKKTVVNKKKTTVSETDKKLEKERKEAEKKAEKERKEADKKAEKERKEAEKKTKPQPKKPATKKVVVVVKPEIDDDAMSSSASDHDDDEEESTSNSKTDKCFSIIEKHIQYWGSRDTNLVYDDRSHALVGKYNTVTKKIIFTDDDEELEEEEYFEESVVEGCCWTDYDELDKADEFEYNIVNKMFS